MLQEHITDIATERSIVAISDAFLVAASDHALILYAAGQKPHTWILQGRHRPLEPGATMVDVVLEGYAWLEEFVARGRRNADLVIDGARVRLAL